MTTLYDTLPSGTLIIGRWHKSRYRVERLLGEGANGKVYLVSRGKSLYALKTGYDVADLQSEVNVLKSLVKSSGVFRLYLIEADDMVKQGVTFPYYVMKYVKGLSPDDFLLRNGMEWTPLIGMNLLRKLQQFHKHGWIFGDLKLENVIVADYGKVELVDFGGVTLKGNAVKQYTEIYDRGYWNAGSRTADDGYDLFSFAVLYIHLTRKPGVKLDYSKVLPQNRNVEVLLDEIKNNPLLVKAAPLLEKALRGQYRSSQEACQDWQNLCYTDFNEHMIQVPAVWLKISFVVSLILFAATVVIFGL